MPSKAIDDLLSHPRHRQVTFDEARHCFVYRPTPGAAPQTFPGLTEWMATVFYPAAHERMRADATKRRKGGAGGKVGGTRIHRQLQHWVQCRQQGRCSCGQQRGKSAEKYRAPKHWSPLAEQAMEALEKHQLRPVSAELPLVSPAGKRGTKVDLLCETTTAAKLPVLVSLKTGYAAASQTEYGPMRAPFERLQATEHNVNNLQLFFEYLLLKREYGFEPARAETLYVGQTGGSPTRWEPLPAWARDTKLQEEAYVSLVRGL